MSVSWHVAHTQARAEGLAVTSLQQRGYEVLFLRYRAKIRHARRETTELRPYFPRYLFFAASGGLWSAAKAPGVGEVLAQAGQVLTVPEPVIDELRARGDNHGIVTAPARDGHERRRFVAGDVVRIHGGPFQGFLAQVELDTGKQIRLWLEQLGRRTVRLTVPPEAVSPVRRRFA